MNSRIIYICVSLIVIFYGIGSGENLPTDTLFLTTDYAAFLNPTDSQTYVEFYYSLYRSQLGFVGADTLDYQFAGVYVYLTISDSAGNPLDSTSTYFVARAGRNDDLTDNSIRYFNDLPIGVKPGDYNARLTAIDRSSKSIGVKEFEFSVPDFSSDELVSSDIELAYDVKDVTDGNSPQINSQLIKEGRMVIPNPGKIYAKGTDSLLYVYSELYGLDDGAGPQNTFAMRYQIKDPIGTLIDEYGPKKYKKPGETAVISHGIDISELPAGQYRLLFQAIDMDTKKQAMAVKEFSIIDPATKEKPLDSTGIKTMLNVAWYYLSEAEKIRIPKLSLSGQYSYLTQFWRDRDPDPSTPNNPILTEAIRRYNYANEHFPSHQGKEGWQTDRGRVYITYGHFDEESEIQMPTDAAVTLNADALLVWKYYGIEKGVFFIFVNDARTWADDFRLVHSNHSREVHDQNYLDLLNSIAPEQSWKETDYNDVLGY